MLILKTPQTPSPTLTASHPYALLAVSAGMLGPPRFPHGSQSSTTIDSMIRGPLFVSTLLRSHPFLFPTPLAFSSSQQWAAGESILQEASLAGLIGDAGSGSSLFPLLRAAADLLMMPKELLMDKAIRLDVCCVLSMG